jgi:hypothetical protein
MVENDLRSRIASALSKIIDDQKYVIDVDVDIEVTGEKKSKLQLFQVIGQYMTKHRRSKN